MANLDQGSFTVVRSTHLAFSGALGNFAITSFGYFRIRQPLLRTKGDNKAAGARALRLATPVCGACEHLIR